jgi:hypothetical protein
MASQWIVNAVAEVLSLGKVLQTWLQCELLCQYPTNIMQAECAVGNNFPTTTTVTITTDNQHTKVTEDVRHRE